MQMLYSLGLYLIAFDLSGLLGVRMKANLSCLVYAFVFFTFDQPILYILWPVVEGRCLLIGFLAVFILQILSTLWASDKMGAPFYAT